LKFGGNCRDNVSTYLTEIYNIDTVIFAIFNAENIHIVALRQKFNKQTSLRKRHYRVKLIKKEKFILARIGPVANTDWYTVKRVMPRTQAGVFLYSSPKVIYCRPSLSVKFHKQ